MKLENENFSNLVIYVLTLKYKKCSHNVIKYVLTIFHLNDLYITFKVVHL